MHVNNITIFSSPSELFLSTGDQELIKITGEDRLLLEMLVEKLIKHNDKTEDEIFEILKDYFMHDRDYFNMMINYLVDKNVLIPQNANNEVSSKNILIIGKFKDDSGIEKFKNILDRPKLRYNVVQHFSPDKIKNTSIEDICNSGIDLIVLISPILGNIETFRELSTKTYKAGIPILHAGLDVGSLILGPLIDPPLYTASLYCYLRRKAAGLENLDQYLSATQVKSKKTINDIDISHNALFNVLSEFIGLELEKYYNRNKRTSIIGREIEMDCSFYSSSHVKILKTPLFLK